MILSVFVCRDSLSRHVVTHQNKPSEEKPYMQRKGGIY